MSDPIQARALTIANQHSDLAGHHIQGYAVAAQEAGDVGRFNVPLISHIIGNLYVGGCLNGVRLPDDFVYVASMYPWERFELGPNTNLVEHRLYDSDELPAAELLDQIATTVCTWLRRGPVLVHCQAGLNRSNLVAALVLRKLGYSSADAIALLRERRSPVVLCNRTFERYLLGLDRRDPGPEAHGGPSTSPEDPA